MSIHTKLLYSVTLAAVLFSTGCATADRIDEKVEAEQGPEIQQPEIPNKQDKKDNQNIIPIAPTPIEDNNDTTSVVKVDAKNAYKLSMKLSNSKFQQFEQGILEYDIKELYSGELVDNAIISKLTFSVTDKRYFKFVDFKGTETNELPLDSENGVIDSSGKIRVKMNNNSGTTAITVTANIKLPDGNTYEIKNSIPVVVIKNKTASIAVNPYGTKWIKDGENAGLFVEKYVFHVVDKYGNKAKDGTSVHIGVVNEPKLYTLGYSKVTDVQLNGTGKLNRDKTFTIDSTVNASFLSGTIDNEDNLVILPNENKNDPTYLGAWSIDHVVGENSIQLVDDYTGNTDMKIGDTEGLTFVIGDEDRFNPCSHTLANAAFYFPKGAEVKDGTVYAELRYQPYLFGKTVFVYANAVVDGEKIGIAREMHLMGEGLDEVSVSCKNESNVTMPCSVAAPMNLTGAGNLARWVFPGMTDSTHSFSTTNTECGGFTTVTFRNVQPGKTASGSVGGVIHWEHIINK